MVLFKSAFDHEKLKLLKYLATGQLRMKFLKAARILKPSKVCFLSKITVIAQLCEALLTEEILALCVNISISECQKYCQ